ncbi:MAG: hypothetical protein M1837_001315 [Sclerophora amabilis]|nr:MAG: hypothetical protein M1837_001315 [Sclerophora amabilis]
MSQGQGNDAPRVSRYILREDGSATPLIAADELPEELVITGLSRSIPIPETVKMICVGSEARSKRTFEVKLVPKTGLDPQKRANSEDLSQENPRRRRLLLGQEKLFLQDQDRPVVRLPGVAPKLPALPAEPRSPQVSPRSGMCHRWFQTANCSTGDCPLLHMVPLTWERLIQTGYKDWPAWYKRRRPQHFRTVRKTIPPVKQNPGNNEGTGPPAELQAPKPKVRRKREPKSDLEKLLIPPINRHNIMQTSPPRPQPRPRPQQDGRHTYGFKAGEQVIKYLQQEQQQRLRVADRKAPEENLIEFRSDSDDSDSDPEYDYMDNDPPELLPRDVAARIAEERLGRQPIWQTRSDHHQRQQEQPPAPNASSVVPAPMTAPPPRSNHQQRQQQPPLAPNTSSAVPAHMTAPPPRSDHQQRQQQPPLAPNTSSVVPAPMTAPPPPRSDHHDDHHKQPPASTPPTASSVVSTTTPTPTPAGDPAHTIPDWDRYTVHFPPK